MSLPGVNNSFYIPRWQLSKSCESLLFNFGDQVELKRAYNYIWSQFGGKQFTSAIRSVNYHENSNNENSNPTILEVVFTNDKIFNKAVKRGIRYDNRVILPLLNIRSDVIYIAYPIFDLPLDRQQEVKEMLFDEFNEQDDDIQGGPQSSDNYYDSNDTNSYDSDNLDEEEKQGVVDVVLDTDDVSGLYNGTATVIVRRILPPFLSITQLMDQQRHRHLLSTDVRVYHLYCTTCRTLDKHHDGNC
ncbi:hypothetical protein INT45_000267 [Circinella minor]|uniref:Uncharacterized protein n=1 Tax=Circinella minor TaxID=1195481 RepID=A0A8H7S910_9FUNG|nr:hypothetical protein INT45_000267 [Circinella minor]